MRQAGRYMPEYRKLREKHTLLDICKTPELALEVTLQPLRLGVDAAILFADILLPLEPMGASFEFAKGEGPVIHEPIATASQIDRLRVIDPEASLGYVLAAIRLIKPRGQGPAHRFCRGPVHPGQLSHRGRQERQFCKDQEAHVRRSRRVARAHAQARRGRAAIPSCPGRRRSRRRPALRFVGGRLGARRLCQVRPTAREARSLRRRDAGRPGHSLRHGHGHACSR
jgi:hypothetical protein